MFCDISEAISKEIKRNHGTFSYALEESSMKDCLIAQIIHEMSENDEEMKKPNFECEQQSSDRQNRSEK